jgi:hypothetical protein
MSFDSIVEIKPEKTGEAFQKRSGAPAPAAQCFTVVGEGLMKLSLANTKTPIIVY